MTKNYRFVREGKVEDFTTNELEKMANRANHDLQRVIDLNNQATGEGDSYFYFSSSLIQYLKRRGRMTVSSHTFSKGHTLANIQNSVSVQNGNAVRYINKNNEFIARLKKNSVRPSDYLFIPISSPTLGKTFNVTLVYKSNKELCVRCGEKVAQDRLQEHHKTERCRDRAKLKGLAEAGMTMTQDYKVIKAVKDGVIPGEAIPIKYRFYAPAWAVNAAKLYDKNQGYAGMPFAEFVVRMKPGTEE